MPEWVVEKIPAAYRENAVIDENSCNAPHIKMFDAMTPAQIEALLPEFTAQVHTLMAKRIFEIALRYKGRIHSWDVVNESATDFGKGNLIAGEGICKSVYGLMPGDYPYRAFKIAEGMFPKNAKLNINEWNLGEEYPAEIEDLKQRGCKVDIAGAQMHLFDPQTWGECLSLHR